MKRSLQTPRNVYNISDKEAISRVYKKTYNKFNKETNKPAGVRFKVNISSKK